jgi:hypothetical protein
LLNASDIEWVSEWVSDCCSTPTQQFFSYIMVSTSLFRPPRWVGFFIVLAHWNNSFFLCIWCRRKQKATYLTFYFHVWSKKSRFSSKW